MNVEPDTVAKIVRILHEEIVPAQGCTEPIAIALVAAKAREVLGKIPEHVGIFVSGNIIKNVKSAVVPGSGGMFGIETAAAMGIVAGDCTKDLMVVSDITEQDMAKVRAYLRNTSFKVIHEKTPVKLYVRVEVVAGDQSAEVEVQYLHTNLTRVVKNGSVLLDRGCSSESFHTTEEDRCLPALFRSLGGPGSDPGLLRGGGRPAGPRSPRLVRFREDRLPLPGHDRGLPPFVGVVGDPGFDPGLFRHGRGQPGHRGLHRHPARRTGDLPAGLRPLGDPGPDPGLLRRPGRSPGNEVGF